MKSKWLARCSLALAAGLVASCGANSSRQPSGSSTSNGSTTGTAGSNGAGSDSGGSNSGGSGSGGTQSGNGNASGGNGSSVVGSAGVGILAPDPGGSAGSNSGDDDELDGGIGADSAGIALPCEVNGQIYEPGEGVDASCGGCFCDEEGSGQWQCLAIACFELPSYCQQAFDSGNCDGTFPVFAYNVMTGSCEEEVYGGCGGNLNRFASLEACESGCMFPQGRACEVNGVVYPSGATEIPDPTSCNQCSCEDGTLICTEINCPVPCPEGQAPGTDCAACGPIDNCEISRIGCFTSCTDSEDCAAVGGYCNNQICVFLCG